MSFMMAFGWSSVMLAIGVLLRAKIPFFRSWLVPASVIGGILGLVFMNAFIALNVDVGTDTTMFSEIVNNLFTISFISITLTTNASKDGKKSSSIVKGALGLGLIWCLLYGLSPIIGWLIVAATGGAFDMDPIYGMLIPFAFTQGPGQAASFGAIFEQFGWENASTTAITFAAIGFLVAFALGIPAAKKGIKLGLAKHCGDIDRAILKGYLHKDEQTRYMVKDTTVPSNIETLSYHFVLIGICFVLAVGISKLLALIPGFIGESTSAMMFMNGMYAALIVKWLMKKLHIDFLHENVLQTKITGWTADYLVVCAFMAISLNVIANWIVPIVLVSVIVTVVTFAVCFYFGARVGGSHDFERTLGIYGTCTGTVPTGVALVRIVDPDFETTTSIELGAMNLTMLACTPVYFIILALASGAMGWEIALVCLVACVILYLVLLKVTRTWGKKTYGWKGVEGEKAS